MGKVGVTDLEKHPLSAVKHELGSKLKLALASKLILNIAHLSGPPNRVRKLVAPDDVTSTQELANRHRLPMPLTEISVRRDADCDLIALAVLTFELTRMRQLNLSICLLLRVPLLEPWTHQHACEW